MNVYDLQTGSSLGSLPIAGLAGVDSMRFSDSTNTVLIATIQSNAIIETDLSGAVLRTFVPPFSTSFNDVTRGPNGHVFATATGDSSVLEWDATGAFIREISTAGATGSAVSIVWAGNVPEPGGSVGAMAAVALAAIRRRR